MELGTRSPCPLPDQGQMSSASEEARGGGSHDSPPPSSTEAPIRRAGLRPSPEKRSRPVLPPNATIVCRIGSSIGRVDRVNLKETLHYFHTNPQIQARGRDITVNAEQYLTAKNFPGKGNHYIRRIRGREVKPEVKVLVKL
jgi:hypothetical protein